MKNRKILLAFGLLAAFIYVQIKVWPSNQSAPISGDESQMVFAAYHPPTSGCLKFLSLSTIASMPWSYLENSLYYRLVALWPTSVTYPHLEGLLRLPLSFYCLLTIFCLGFALYAIVPSVFFVLFIVCHFFVARNLGINLWSELRFHSAFFAYSALLWTLILGWLNEGSGRSRGRVALMWLTGALYPWTHVYALLNVALILMVAALHGVGFSPLTVVPRSRKFPRTWDFVFFAFLAANSARALQYFVERSAKTTLRSGGPIVVGKYFTKAWSVVTQDLWGSLFWAILAVLVLYGAETLYSKNLGVGRPRRRDAYLNGTFALLCLVLTWGLAFQLTRIAYVENDVQRLRYVAAFLIPTILFTTFWLRNFLARWLRTLSMVSGLGLVVLIATFPGPFWPQDYWQPNPWSEVKIQIQKFALLQRVEVAVGLPPSGDLPTRAGIFQGTNYRLYLHGPFPYASDPALAPDSCLYSDLHSTENCSQLSRFSEWNSEKDLKHFIPVIDFCNPAHYRLLALPRAEFSEVTLKKNPI